MVRTSLFPKLLGKTVVNGKKLLMVRTSLFPKLLGKTVVVWFTHDYSFSTRMTLALDNTRSFIYQQKKKKETNKIIDNSREEDR